MNRYSILLVLLSMVASAEADCPLDHFLIGCNEDGIIGTADDMRLFADRSNMYRHSDPDNSGDPTWLHWHYPLYYNIRYDRYQNGEPGFDTIKTEDPNRMLTGVPDANYRVIVRCLNISPGFSARQSALGVLLDSPGDSFSHSSLSDPHIHLEYRAPSPQGASQLFWITYRLEDEFGHYQPSEPLTLAFVIDPLLGDIVLDDSVNGLDLAAFADHWLDDNCSYANDFCSRADSSRDGLVNFADFAILAQNWLAQ
jgi:hypothetical protein